MRECATAAKSIQYVQYNTTDDTWQELMYNSLVRLMRINRDEEDDYDEAPALIPLVDLIFVDYDTVVGETSWFWCSVVLSSYEFEATSICRIWWWLTAVRTQMMFTLSKTNERRGRRGSNMGRFSVLHWGLFVVCHPNALSPFNQNYNTIIDKLICCSLNHHHHHHHKSCCRRR